MFSKFVLALLAALTLTVIQAQEVDTVVLLTHDSFAASESVLEAFEAETGIALQILRSGDAGAMVNQAILSKNNPLGDALFGIDNTFLSRALAAEIFAPYESPELAHVDQSLLPDDSFRVTPIDYGDVCVNYDIGYFETHELALPSSLSDLTSPEYESLLVAQNPATSSPGLAFLLATVSVFGADAEYDYLDFWGRSESQRCAHHRWLVGRLLRRIQRAPAGTPARAPWSSVMPAVRRLKCSSARTRKTGLSPAP